MKINYIIIGVFFCLSTHAQVFNSGSNIGGKAVTIGIEPTLMGIGSADQFLLFLHGDVKLVPAISLTAKIGVGEAEYFGGALKWNLAKIISVSAGAHKFGNWGLDGSFIFSIPLSGGAKLYAGGDMDLNFVHNDIHAPLWVPVGISAGLSKALRVALEAELGAANGAYHIFGGGLIIVL